MNIFKETIEKILQEAKLARLSLSHQPGIIVGDGNPVGKGDYLSNYAKCLINRKIDIFDDSIFLLENDRIPAACSISRGMIETYAFAKFLSKKIAKILTEKSGQKSVDDALSVLMNFTNSSRFKETEQKKMDKGVFNPNDYMLTEQAKHRFTNMLASSQHVMDALRDLYKDELDCSKEKESQFEITYDTLSEWVHPSQTSIFHNYVPEAHLVPTSMGILHIYDGAKMSCARALHFISDSKNIYDGMIEMANEISRRSNERN